MKTILFIMMFSSADQNNKRMQTMSALKIYVRIYAKKFFFCWIETNKQALSSNQKLQSVVCCLEAVTDKQTLRLLKHTKMGRVLRTRHIIVIFVSPYKYLVTRIVCHTWIKIDHHSTTSFINHLFRCQLIPSSLDLTPHLQWQQPSQRKQQLHLFAHLNFDEIAQYACCACNHFPSHRLEV